MKNKIYDLEAMSLADTLELLPETLKNHYKNTSFIDWEKAKKKYSSNIKWADISNILQFYIGTRLSEQTEQELKENIFTIEIPEEMVTCMSYINQLSLVFRKGDSLFSVQIDRYRKLTIQYIGEAYHDCLTWFYDIKNLLCTEGVVKDANYCTFWGISNDYREV
ncbi:MAG: hypothetical protein E7Z87_08480 [Cyanobacteria bacterium SIG26]|nr:hypothetical protein [Cyanobacteria bacterium SIG26]